MPTEEVVITGVGVVSPIGVGRAKVWEAFCSGRSGVGPIRAFDPTGLPVRIAGEVVDFDPRPYLKQRKNLKIMSRDAPFGVVASILARRDAGMDAAAVDPERFGVILGGDRISGTLEDSTPPYRSCMMPRGFDFGRWGTEGMAVTFPLSFLKVLPNMTASHVSIVQDARGPNNTIHQGAMSSLLAIAEATRVIQRGAADVMIAGGASSQMQPNDWVGHCRIARLSTHQNDPRTVLRPYDADRTGTVWGEGAAAFILERRRQAENRGAPILARILGWASTCEPQNGSGLHGTGLQRAIRSAVANAGLTARDVGHVNAHGLGVIDGDRIEAGAIRACLADVPVTAPKSYFGNLGAGGGAVELVASVLSFAEGRVPATLNYHRPDPDCPVRVIHGEPLGGTIPTAVAVNWSWIGQAGALVLAGPD